MRSCTDIRVRAREAEFVCLWLSVRAFVRFLRVCSYEHGFLCSAVEPIATLTTKGPYIREVQKTPSILFRFGCFRCFFKVRCLNIVAERYDGQPA